STANASTAYPGCAVTNTTAGGSLRSRSRRAASRPDAPASSMSRKTASHRRSSGTASAAVAASPTTTTAGCAPSRCRSSSRAGASSSTIATLIRPLLSNAHGVASCDGNLEPDDRAERERAKAHTFAVEHLQPVVDAREPEPRAVALRDARLEHALDRFARDPAAVVANGDVQPPAAHACAHDEP